jgi:subtilisin-like proprotein convertase family protein
VRDPADPVLAGVTVYHDANENGTFDATPPTTITSTNVPLALPDLTFVNSTTPVSGFIGNITDVNVTLSISHTSVAHLDVFLIAPDGTRVELFTDVGGTGDNFTNTALDQQAATAITSGVAPFNGTFRPEGNLNTLNGRNPNGTWTLEVRDDTSGTTGTLTAWSLRMSSGEVSTVSDAGGSFGLSVFAAGNYTFRWTGPAGFAPTGAGSFVVNLPTGTSTATFDAGQIQSAPAVYGNVFTDTNSNGNPDPGEAGQAGRIVFVDADNNGTLNGGETQTTTSALGNYYIPLTAGAHQIRLVPLAGMAPTLPANNLHSINVTTGPVTGRNFGQLPSSAPIGTVLVGSGPSRSRIENLTVTFSEIVTFTNNDPEAAFALTRTGSGPVTLDAAVNNVGGQTIVTLTFLSGTEFGSLVDGRYVLTVDHTRIQDLASNQLLPMAPTNFHRFFGDHNGDANVDIADFGQYSTTHGLNSGQAGFISEFDFNDDGVIDITDFGQLSIRMFTVLP